MVKVVRPLFSDSAHGPIADIGSFRMSPHGPQFIAQADPHDPKTPGQLQARECFKRARTEWLAIEPTPIPILTGWKYRILPPWPEFWRQWLEDHPECRP